MRASFHLFFRSLLALTTSCWALAALGQSAQISEEQLTAVLPQAERFSTKQGEPPVYIGYASSAEDAEIVGYAFETTDFEPQEIGYSAPIEVLVGIDLEGELAGIEILFYRESYKSIRGDFLNSERFPNQFAGKSVSEGFRVGRDIDGVSRATISSWAVSRGIRNSAREVASAYLGEAAIFANASFEDQALSLLAPLSWEGLIDDGLVKPWPVSLEDGSQIELTVAFMGNEKLGEMLVGSEDYSRAEREASNRVSAGTLLLIGIAGNASSPFRQENLALQQNEWTYQVERRRFVYVGSAEEGKSRNKMRFAGAIVLPPEVDIAQPFTLFYNTGIEVDSIDQLEQVVYQVPPIALALAQGRQVPAEFLPDIKDEYADLPVETSLQALLNSAPWSETALLVLLLCVATTAFVLKNVRLRWAALLFTFVYLGFVNGTFLSVSHLTNFIKQGPGLFLNDLPLLILVVFTLVTTVFWGRVFCSSLCPFGALQDILERIVPKRWRRTLPQWLHDWALWLKYIILAGLMVTAVSYSELTVFQYFEPFGTLFYQSQSFLLWAILFLFVLGSVFVPRFYCRYACPLGASLGVISLAAFWKIKRVPQCEVCKVCESACPTGAIRMQKIDFKECVRCDVCESKLINQAGVCKHSVESVMSRHKTWQPVTVK
ncbi:4Fe-4S binding protein [Gammaproteobacteria bacterium]|nr:4Fe-4S binding protein [Gammaproteobacteria bacterium]